MKKVLCGSNRYEITVKTLGKAIKSHGKAEKPVRRANFVSKWYVIHMFKGHNRFDPENQRKSLAFFVFRLFSRFFKNRDFNEIHRFIFRFGTSTLNWTEDRRVDMLELFTIERYTISN